MFGKRTWNWREQRQLAAALLTVTLALACKDIAGVEENLTGGTPAGSVADTVTVVIENFAFKTQNGTDSITVALGQTVRFVNRDAAPHTATSTSAPAGDPGFDSGRLSANQEYFWTPPMEGGFVYRCDFHPVDMSGALILVGAAAVPPDTTDVPPDNTGGGGSSPDTIVVDIVDFSFRGPDGSSRIEVALGQTVKFVNRDDADHTATSTSSPQGAGGFVSGNLDTGQVFFWTPPQTGDWDFQCEYHPEMVGTIVVTESGDGGDDDDDTNSPVNIDIIDGGFVGPNGDVHVTITLGQTVTWVNTGNLVHTASAKSVPDGAERFDSGELAPGEQFSFTPDRVGVWEYRCDEHSDEPEGTITVQ